jgi:hypothetical protein
MSTKPPIEEMIELVKGRSIVIVGGDPRPEAEERLRRAFQVKELYWPDDTGTGAAADYEHLVAREDVVLVLLLIRWARFGYGELADICRRYGKLFVRIPGGYGVRQIAEQVMNKHRAAPESQAATEPAQEARKAKRRVFTSQSSTDWRLVSSRVESVEPRVEGAILTDRKAKKLIRKKHVKLLPLLKTLREVSKENKAQWRANQDLGKAIQQVERELESADRWGQAWEQEARGARHTLDEVTQERNELRRRVSYALEFTPGGGLYGRVIQATERIGKLDPLALSAVAATSAAIVIGGILKQGPPPKGQLDEVIEDIVRHSATYADDVRTMTDTLKRQAVEFSLTKTREILRDGARRAIDEEKLEDD